MHDHTINGVLGVSGSVLATLPGGFCFVNTGVAGDDANNPYGVAPAFLV